MLKIIKELTVDVTKPNMFQAIVAKQYDMNTRFLKVTFADCGTKIDIPMAETNKAIINAERSDGQSDGFYGEINEDGTVTVPLHSWMLEKEGTVNCDISVLCDNNQKLTTTTFTLLVEKAAYGGEDITSDPQYDVLIELIERAESLSDGNSLRLINQSELAVDASGFSVSVDSDGRPFSCQTIYIAFDIMPDLAEVPSRKISLRVGTNNNARFLSYQSITFLSTHVGTAGMLKAEFIGGITTSELRHNTYPEGAVLSGTSQEYAICSISNRVNKPITDLNFYLYDTTAKGRVTMKAGSKIEVWGCNYDNLS